MADQQRRQLNLNGITGMSVEDFTVDQSKAREIVNLRKDKDGWTIRDGKKDLLTLANSTDDISAFFIQGGQIVIHYNNTMRFYAIDGDGIGDLLETFEFEFAFKLFKTQYNNTFFMIDTTNRKNYICEINDRLMTLIDDVGVINLSTELLFNEMNIQSKDATWGGLAKHATYTGGSKVWTDSIDRYCIDWANGGSAPDWEKISFLQQVNYSDNSIRYIIVLYNDDDSESYLYLFDWGDEKPAMWTSKTEIKTTAPASVDVFNNGGDIQVARFMDVAKIKDTAGWTKMGTLTDMEGNNLRRSLTVANNSLLVVERNVPYIFNYDNNNWDLLDGFGSEVQCFVEYDSNIVAGGNTPSVIKKWENSAWTQLGSNSPASSINCLIEFNSELYAGTGGSGVYKLNTTTNLWETVNTGIGVHIYDFEIVSGVLYTTTFGGGIYWTAYLSSGSWIAIGGTGSIVYRALYDFDGVLYRVAQLGTASIQKWVTGSWVAVANPSNYLFNQLTSVDNVLVGATNSNDGVVVFDGSSWSEIYAPSAEYIQGIITWNDKLYMLKDDGVFLNTGGFVTEGDIFLSKGAVADTVRKISLATATLGQVTDHEYIGIIEALSIKIMDLFYTLIGVRYAIIADDDTSNVYLKVYVEEKYNSSDGLEDEAQYEAVTDANAILVDYDLTGFTGMHLVKNDYYTGEERGATLIVMYDNKFKLFDFWVTTDAGTTTLQVEVYEDSITLPSKYQVSDQQCVSGSQVASISENGKAHNFYATNGKHLFKYQITGNVMTAADINATEKIYNRDITPYGDESGDFLGAFVSNPRGYTLTEINRSAKMPVRPYFKADSGTENNLYAPITQTSIDFTPTSGSNVVEITGGITSMYDFGVGWTFTGTDIPEGATITDIDVDNSTITLTAKVNSSTPRTNGGSVAPSDDYELHNVYRVPSQNLGVDYKTPIEIGAGGQVLQKDTTDGTLIFKYWLFYFVKAGLYDPTIAQINIAMGIGLGATDSYKLNFWEANEDYSIFADINYDGNLPQAFSNYDIQTYITDDMIENPEEVYIGFEKILFKRGDKFRDKFAAEAYWLQWEAERFLLQDLVDRSDGMTIGIDYEKQEGYFGLGYKFLCKINRLGFKSKPTGIINIEAGAGLILCESDVYSYNGSDVRSFRTDILEERVGLEYGNGNAIATNTRIAFFQNRFGIYLVFRDGVTRISDPILKYLYASKSGNVLAVDSIHDELYVLLDNSKVDSIKAELIKGSGTGDYGISSSEDIEYGDFYGVCNYSDFNGDPKSVRWRIYAYEKTDSITRHAFIGNFENFVILRTENKLIIPEYRQEEGTENPLCRFEPRRMTFGNAHSRTILQSILAEFVTNNSVKVNYLRIRTVSNEDSSSEISYKYGNFDEANTYTDDTGGSTHLVGTLGDVDSSSFERYVARFGNEFFRVRIRFEIARLKDANFADVTLTSIYFDTTDKMGEKHGLE